MKLSPAAVFRENRTSQPSPRVGVLTRAVVFLGLGALLVSTTSSAAAGPLDSETTGKAEPARTWQVAYGPAGVSAPHASIALDRQKGALTLAVRSAGKTVISPSRLGVVTGEADFTSGLRFTGAQRRNIEETYSMKVGKQRNRHYRAHQLRLSFETGSGSHINVVVRASADGIAYRYVLPDNDDSVTVVRESSRFRFPPDARAWLQQFEPSYEEPRFVTGAGKAPADGYTYPSLFKAGGRYVLVTESGVAGSYSGSHLVHKGNGTYGVHLAGGNPVTGQAPLRTPWRVVITGGLATVTESTLVDDLAPESKIEDTSWIKPGQAAWSWWSDAESPGSLQKQKEYIDYAARQGWEYVLVDEGWNADWVPELVDYARQQGVGIFLWYRWTDLDTVEGRTETLPQLVKWGVKGIKIDFMESDSQQRFRWYDTLLKATARHHLMVNFHGGTILRGLQRTWPHVMTAEAVRGGEYYHPCCGRITPKHNLILPFTRNVTGSMDYTPVTFAAPERKTSQAHEVALSVVYESGIQHFADSIKSYRGHPVAERFLSHVPAVWDETHLVAGKPGKVATFARRHGRSWYVGSISAGGARTLEASLSFLPQGQWMAEIIRDEKDGLVRERKCVTRHDVLRVHTRSNGGFATRLRPARQGGEVCGPVNQGS